MRQAQKTNSHGIPRSLLDEIAAHVIVTLPQGILFEDTKLPDIVAAFESHKLVVFDDSRPSRKPSQTSTRSYARASRAGSRSRRCDPRPVAMEQARRRCKHSSTLAWIQWSSTCGV